MVRTPNIEGPVHTFAVHSFQILFLDLPRDVICSMARFRLHAHTLRIETVTWTHNTSPICYKLHNSR